jgi:hypothetical protein
LIISVKRRAELLRAAAHLLWGVAERARLITSYEEVIKETQVLTMRHRIDLHHKAL